MVYEIYWIPGIFMIVGIITSVIIAPHINWGIEKKKIKLKERKGKINKVRNVLFGYKSPLEFQEFRNHHFYREIKPYLSKDFIKRLEELNELKMENINYLDADGTDRYEYDFREDVEKELCKLEKKWDLI